MFRENPDFIGVFCFLDKLTNESIEKQENLCLCIKLIDNDVDIL